jgi:S-adenosylmethionine:tRNA ribosyltransferase-isomerase
MLKLSDFDFELPANLIAQEPAKPRDHARFLVLGKEDGSLSHKRFDDLPKLLKKGDVLVFNHSQVFPARLLGNKAETGGKMEVLLLHDLLSFPLPDLDASEYAKISGSRIIWQCLVGGKSKAGMEIVFPGNIKARLLEDQGNGTWIIAFFGAKANLSPDSFMEKVFRFGQMPLPPYIKDNHSSRERYQTVFADSKQTGSVAAPTAGLHFTPRLMAALKAAGIQIEYVTLHVGLGTFAPVKEEDITKHDIHSEWYKIDKAVKARLEKAKASGRRIIAVGTTSARVLESASAPGAPLSGWTKIFIYPSYKFRLVDALVTNFHLPKSTLLMLVSALASRDKIMAAYQEAINEKYRFFSYGDAMLIQ